MTRRTIEIATFCIVLLIGAMALHAWLASRDEQQRLASTLAAQKQLLDAADARERTRQSALDDTLAQIENLKRETQTPAQILRDLPKYLSLPQPITMTPANGQGIDQSAKGGSQPSSTAATEEPKNQTEAQGQGLAKDDARTEPSDLPGSTYRRPGSRTLLPQAVAQAAGPQRPPADTAGLSPSCDSAGNCAAQIPSADLKPLYDYVQDCRACQAQLAAAKQNSSDDAAKIAALIRERDAAITASKGGTFWRRLRRNAEWFAVGAALGAAAGYKASKR
jgi:type II secretory pathway pseudopilin PulG